MLHKPAVMPESTEGEHCRRVWWTTFQMDVMTSIALGLTPTLRLSEAQQSLPTNQSVRTEDFLSFRDPRILTAHIELSQIQANILDAVAQLQEEDLNHFEAVTAQYLSRLEKWRDDTSADQWFDLSYGVPASMTRSPSMRSLASIYLRYHQVSNSLLSLLD